MLKKETSSLLRRPPCPSYGGVCDHYALGCGDGYDGVLTIMVW